MALVQHAAIVAGVDVVPAQGIEPICLGALGQRKTDGLTMIDSCKADPSRSSETSCNKHLPWFFITLQAHRLPTRPASSGSWWDQCEILACPSSTSSDSRSCAQSNASSDVLGSDEATRCWSAAKGTPDRPCRETSLSPQRVRRPVDMWSSPEGQKITKGHLLEKNLRIPG